MDTKELQEILKQQSDRPAEVKVVLAMPSIGPVASTKVTSAAFGFDWESGKFLLRTEEPLVPKPKEMEAYQAAVDLLLFLASKKQKRETYEVRQAKKVLKRAGFTDEQIEKYSARFRRD